MYGCVFVTVLFLLQLSIIEGKFNNVCRKNSSNGISYCYNMYILKKQKYIQLESGISTTIQTRYDWKALEGITVRVIADNMLPYITSNNYSKELGGYLGDIWNIIQQALKFRSQIISVNYDGGLELMTQGKADIMLAAAVEKPGLLNIEYSQPYFYNWYYLFVKQPTPKGSSVSYLKTFDINLWVATSSLFIILAGSLWLTTKLLYESKYEHKISFISCLIIVSGGFLNQGTDIKLKSYSARIQVFVSFVIGYLLYSAMTAVLVSQLAIFEIELPYKSLSDIAEKRTHSLCLRTNSFVYNNFTDANRTVLPKWQNILNGPGCLDINNQTNLAKILCDDGVIFLENWIVMSTVIKNNKIPCEVTYLNHKYFMKANYFLLLKSFQQKYIINTFAKQMRSNGIMKRLQTKWFKGHFPTDSQTSSHVTIDHISGLLTIYFSFIIGCLLILALEKLHKNFFNDKKRL